ncbi:hypothetical protein Krac_5844 [Ktedonobacter racemifer DSM 44963]|uniref:Uncharacterized protein n=1 Tax=Ktedonobacter racemifer DSM 44963 TaxID=485913 RepID=D6TX08_KTERA|nr:hypothetical protein Krac_5844 [Ktedonobacter racemifer DSM 44963]
MNTCVNEGNAQPLGSLGENTKILYFINSVIIPLTPVVYPRFTKGA